MINITQYFKENISKNDYYKYHFEGIAYDETIREYRFFDDIELIEKFKRFLKKKLKEDISLRDEDRYIIISFYLDSNGYYIREIPEYLARPYDKAALPWLFKEIDKHIENVDKYNKKELLRKKEKFIDDMNIIKKGQSVPENIEECFRIISNRDASFNDMSENEKLETICNAIEYYLKNDREKFDKYIFSEKLNIINNEMICQFRKTIQCFRHASKKDINERDSYNSFEKDLMIRYGLFIIETIQKKQSNNIIRGNKK